MPTSKTEGIEQSVVSSATSSMSMVTDQEALPESIDVGTQRKGSWSPAEDRELSGLIKVSFSHINHLNADGGPIAAPIQYLAACLHLFLNLHFCARPVSAPSFHP